VAIAVDTAGGTRGRPSAASSFQLVFVGKHNEALLHEGSFTTTSPLCPAGVAADVSVNEGSLTAERRFTCDGAAGGFTARVGSLPAEHGGSGAWKIIDGSGPLQDMRGKGTFTSVRLSGSADDPASITFRSTWQGLVGLDSSPPAVRVSSASARRTGAGKRTAVLRLTLSVRDAGGDAVAYSVTVTDRRAVRLASRSGQTATGAAHLSLLVRPPLRTRALRLTIVADDVLGNSATLVKAVTIR
jgi:hypothetical protein